MQRMTPPFRGVSNNTGFVDTQPGFAPYSTDENGLPRLRNVIPHTPSARDRGQIGQRAGHSKLFPVQAGGPGGAPWQDIISVSRSSIITGYTIGSCITMTSGTSLESGALVGNYWQLDSVPSMDGIGALGTGSVNASAVCPLTFTNTDGTDYFKYFVSSNTTSGGYGIATIKAVRDDTGAQLWSYTVSETMVDRYINTMCCSDNFLFVFTNAVILMIRVSDGSLVHTDTFTGWSQEAVEGGIYKDSSDVEWLFAGFNGSSTAGSTQPPYSYPITAGNPAVQFRAGVMRFQINNEYTSTTGPYLDARPLIRDTYGWGQTLDFTTGLPNNASSPFNEGFHGYFRVSEHSSVTGHGCLVTGVCVNPQNGNVIISRTNQGYGPNASYPPDGNVYPAISVMGISFGGSRLFETDTGSILEPGLDGYTNDIPTGSGDDPSLLAIRCNAIGIVCAGGRQNDAGFSLFGMEATTGTIQWASNFQDVTGAIRQGCMTVDPGDQGFVFGGDRNTAWDNSMSADAHLWKVNPTTGIATWTNGGFDLGSAVSALTVSAMPDGSLVYGSDYIA